MISSTRISLLRSVRRVVAALPLLCACASEAPSLTSPSHTGDEDAPTGDGVVAVPGDGRDDAPVVFCDGVTAVRYDPPLSRLTLPDDVFTRNDPTTLTGLRVSFAHARDQVADAFVPHYTDLESLDGFGVTAPATVVLSGPPSEETLPEPGRDAASWEDSVILVQLTAPPKPVSFDWELIPEAPGEVQTTLLVTPRVPLLPRTRHALLVTTRLRDPAGACISPSPTLRLLLAGAPREPALQRIQPVVAAAARAMRAMGAIDELGEISALTVFTTQHTYEGSIAVAQQLRGQAFTLDEEAPCSDPGADATYRLCEQSILVGDYRKGGRAIDEGDLRAHAHHRVPVSVYLPATGSGPYPTIIYGHGLGGSREQGGDFAPEFAARGWAIVASDALKHGEHPDQPELLLSPLPDMIARIYAFFGLSVTLTEETIFDPLAQRDNWRQSTYERLQLLEALRPGVDVDGDGTSDVGLASAGTAPATAYMGISMGGIMGAELVALSGAFSAAVLIVPGARVSSIINQGLWFDAAMIGLRRAAVEGKLARLFPVWQAIIDPGDPGVYAPMILRAPLTESRPDTLMIMVANDTIIPNTSNALYARALGVPHVGEVLVPVGPVGHLDAPVRDNAGPTLTTGLFQYDVGFVEEGPELDTASHMNIGRDPITQLQVQHFLQTHFDTGSAEIIDPYRVLGVKGPTSAH